MHDSWKLTRKNANTCKYQIHVSIKILYSGRGRLRLIGGGQSQISAVPPCNQPTTRPEKRTVPNAKTLVN
jgi:hypothetical protein